MDRTLAVRTPESITFSYELAGIGSRFLAVAIDMGVQLAILWGIVWGLVLIATHVPAAAPGDRETYSASLELALIVTIVFLIFFGYFIAFEAFWQGQTPGKKVMGLRVVRDGGYPIDFGASAIRNIVRIGEFALGFYAAGAIVALCSRENKRLGDMAAGTVVIREARAATLASLIGEAQTQNAARPLLLSKEQLEVIDRFNARRKSLEPHVRAAIAARIADQIRPRLSYDLRTLPDEELIDRLSAS